MSPNDIQRYLERKTSPEESEKIRAWLTDSRNDARVRQILGEIWTGSEIKLNGTLPDFRQMLDKVHHQINNRQLPRPKAFTTTLYHYFSKAAAILLIPLLLLSAYFYFNPVGRSEKEVSVTWREIYTKPGTRQQIDLADGTRVWLNDGTTFRYPVTFSGEKREVFVDGEAYFEVKANAKHPFTVNNPVMNTVVTGTRFNLNAYSDDQYFEATLLEGKVSLERNNQKLTMQPGEQVQYDALENQVVYRTVNPLDSKAWVDGKLIFKDEKMSSAIRKLARWYNIEIILTDPEINNYLLTGTIQDEKLEQTLKLISLAVPVDFEFKKTVSKTELQRIIYMKRK